MRLSEVVEEHPSLIPVINRFGIRLGLGDASVRAICEAHALDTDFLLTVINTFLNEEYFPEKKLQAFHTSQIIDYLTQTNQYYARYQLPNIERHLNRAYFETWRYIQVRIGYWKEKVYRTKTKRELIDDAFGRWRQSGKLNY